MYCKNSDDKKIKEVTPEILQQNGLVGKNDLVKILGRGELSTKLKVTAHKFSKAAAAIEAAGGSTENVE